MSILNPNGTTLASTLVSAGGGNINAAPLPANGTYTVVIDPSEGKTVSLTLTITELAPVS
jgi:hypothetical protein